MSQKTHTTNVSTFQTPTHGPLGLIMKQEILYFKTAEPRVRFDLRAFKGWSLLSLFMRA